MGGNPVFVVLETNKAAKIRKWKVKEGMLVSARQVIFIYELTSPECSDKELKFRSTQVGTVRKLLAKEGDIVYPGGVLLEIEECTHPTVMKDMCAECGADLRKNEQVSTNASVPMIHSIPDLKVSEEQAQIIGKADENRLLHDRKLVLLVDLDQTLIHTTNDNIPPNLKDVYHFRLYGHTSPWYHTRIRPRTHEFLEEISKYYELHICTFGARNYAHMIAMFLDPEGKYFSHRILSRDECFSANSKTANLKALFPCGDNMVCIIDDREDVWNFAVNLIHVKPYHFFKHTGDINAPPGLTKNENDEIDGFDFSNLDKQPKEEEQKPGEDLNQKKVTTTNSKSKVEILGESTTDKDTEDEVEKKAKPKSQEENKLDDLEKVTNDLQLSEDDSDDTIIPSEKEVKKNENIKSKQNNVVYENEIKIEKSLENKIKCKKKIEEEKKKEKESQKGIEKEIESQKGVEKEKVLKVEKGKEKRKEIKKEKEKITETEKDMEKKLEKEIEVKNEHEKELGKKVEKEMEKECEKKLENETEVANKQEEDLEKKVEKGIEEEITKKKKEIEEEKEIKNKEIKKEDGDKSISKREIDGKKEINVDEKKKQLKIDRQKMREKKTEKSKERKLEKEKEKDSKCEKSTEKTHKCVENEIQKEEDVGNSLDEQIDSKPKKESDELIEVEDPDDYLLYLEDILKNIHKAYYNEYDIMKKSDNKSGIPDLKEVIPNVKRQVLKDCHLVFSGLVPSHIPLQQSRAYMVAISLGATVSHDISPGCTHLVAARPGTAKVNSSRRQKGIIIVTPLWLWHCAERWERLDERLYPLGRGGIANRVPPAHCGSPERNAADETDQYSPALRNRTPSGRFIDTINPLLTFSSEDMKIMDQEVEDLFKEDDDDDETESEIEKKIPNAKIPSKVPEIEDSSTTSSEDSLSGASHPKGWSERKSRKRKADTTTCTETEYDEESPSVKFRRGEPLPSDLDLGDDSQDTLGSDEAMDDGEWNMMGAALEREFLSGE